MKMSNWKCKQCTDGRIYPNRSDLIAHKKAELGYVCSKAGGRPKKPKQIGTKYLCPSLDTRPTALDRILDAKNIIRKAMSELDIERSQLSERITMIDTQIASYKQFTAQ